MEIGIELLVWTFVLGFVIGMFCVVSFDLMISSRKTDKQKYNEYKQKKIDRL